MRRTTVPAPGPERRDRTRRTDRTRLTDPRGRRGRRARRAVALVAASTALLVAAPGTAQATSPTGQRPDAPSGTTVYVALGDSYSSGTANPPYDPAAPDCQRSATAWPGRTGDRLGWTTVNLACAGATTAAVTTGYKGQPAQADALAAVDPAADVVSVTVGGNDAGFGTVLGACLLADCAETGVLAASKAFMLTGLPQRLSTAYRRIRAAAPGADLVVVGYPRLFPSSARDVTGCPWLTDDERRGLNRAADLLNAVIAWEAHRAGARFVDVRRALRGHELCTAEPWVYPLGQDADVSSWAHPTAPGQQAIADRVTRSVRRLG